VKWEEDADEDAEERKQDREAEKFTGGATGHVL